MPQIPVTMANELRVKFDTLAEKFPKNTLVVSIDLRKKELTQLQAEKKHIVKNTQEEDQ